jgi:hypothetical protein
MPSLIQRHARRYPFAINAHEKISPTPRRRGDNRTMRLHTAPQSHVRRYSEHRLARLFTWARLWMQWALAAFAQHRDAKTMRPHLERMRRIIACLVFLRACERQPRRRLPAPRARLRRRNSALRILIGARFRRALRGSMLRGRDLPARIHALARIMADPEPAIAALGARLSRRFTRLKPLPAPPALLSLASAAPAPKPALADTS